MNSEEQEGYRPLCQYCGQNKATGTMQEQFHDHYSSSDQFVFTMFTCDDCAPVYEREELPYPSPVRGCVFRRGYFAKWYERENSSYVAPEYYKVRKTKWGWRSHEGD